MGYHDLALDRQVRDWVFIPLTVSIVLMKLLAQYMHQLTHTPANSAKKPLAEIREAQAVQRSQRTRQFGGWIPEVSLKMRKEFYAGKEHGLFQQKPATKPPHETMASDPSFMMDMMKKNLTGIIPQLVMGAWVTFFFSGFVMGKIPFPLSPRFRPMLQRGVDLTNLDVSYFTSLSYYIILLFSLRGIFSLIFREDTLDETEMMRRQMNPMAAQPPGAMDAVAAFKTEVSGYESYAHEWLLEDAEECALETLRREWGGKAKVQ